MPNLRLFPSTSAASRLPWPPNRRRARGTELLPWVEPPPSRCSPHAVFLWHPARFSFRKAIAQSIPWHFLEFSPGEHGRDPSAPRFLPRVFFPPLYDGGSLERSLHDLSRISCFTS